MAFYSPEQKLYKIMKTPYGCDIAQGVVLDRYHSHGFTGEGITVAVLDSGISLRENFEDERGQTRIKYFQNFVKDCHKKKEYAQIYECCDDNGHGSHVAGIIGARGYTRDGYHIGMAPKVKMIVLKILDEKGKGNTQAMIDALDWLLLYHEVYKVRVINISIGMTLKRGMNRDCQRIVERVEALWDRGIVVVAAAGNDGPGPYTITCPGVSRKIITVGIQETLASSYFAGRSRDYSSCGPVPGTCVCKPDILAPGKEILSCNGLAHGYEVRSGTSMSAPVVSGAIAMLLSACPEMTNFEIKKRLMETGIDLGAPKNRQGWGALNLEDFLMM